MTEPKPERQHEIGYENLNFEWFNILTGFDHEAFLRWQKLSPKVRRDIVGIAVNPEEMQKIRDFFSD